MLSCIPYDIAVQKQTNIFYEPIIITTASNVIFNYFKNELYIFIDNKWNKFK